MKFMIAMHDVNMGRTGVSVYDHHDDQGSWLYIDVPEESKVGAFTRVKNCKLQISHRRVSIQDNYGWVVANMNKDSNENPFRIFGEPRFKVEMILSQNTSASLIYNPKPVLCSLCRCESTTHKFGFEVCNYHYSHGEDDPFCPNCK